MTIDDAIGNLTLFYNGYKSRPDPDLLDAAKLGEKALTAIKLQRQDPDNNYIDDLPGETKA